MSKNRKIKDEKIEESEENESDESENDNYEYQYVKTTQITEDEKNNDQEYEEQGIKINLAKIEERPPDEEESCISSIILSKNNKRLYKKIQNYMIKLKKILKYKNELYYYFKRWKNIINNISVKKRVKKMKKKKKKSTNKYAVGDASMSNEEENVNNIENKTNKKLYNYMPVIMRNPNAQKIKSNLKFFIEYNKSKKAVKKNYFNLWKEYVNSIIEKEEYIKKNGIKYNKMKNKNIFEDEKNDYNYFSHSSSGQKRKELKMKKNGITISNSNKEIKRPFRYGQLNDNILNKYEEFKNVINSKNIFINEENNISSFMNIEDKEENENNKDNGYISNDVNDEGDSQRSDKTSENGERQEKTKGAKGKKKKVKKKKNKKKKLKKIIKKINKHKIKQFYFTKWLTNCGLNNNTDIQNKNAKNLGIKLADILSGEENNNIIKKYNSLNQDLIFIPPNLINNGEDINNNYFNGNNGYDFNNDEYNGLVRKKSLFIEGKPVEMVQRKYTHDISPEVKENTYSVIKLSGPIKEMYDKEKGSLEVRIAEEYIEYGTEIIRYPSEITETITTTTRIIPDDKVKENKTITEQEIIFQDKKIIKKNGDEIINVNDKNFNDNLKIELDKLINKEYTNIYNNELVKKDYNNNNIYNNEIIQKDYNNNIYNNYIINNNKVIKNNSLKNRNKKNNIVVKENEVPKIVKKRSTTDIQNGFDYNYNNNNYYTIEKEEKNNYYPNSNKKLSFKSNNYINEQNKQKEDINLNKPSKNLSNNLLNPLNKNSEEKEIKKNDKNNMERKQKRLIKRYKKALHLLRKVIRSRKKRNKKNFNPEIKEKYYFDLWASKTFPEGIDIYHKSQNIKNNNKTKLNTFEEQNNNKSKIKEKLIKLIDLVTTYAKRNKIIKLNDKYKDIDKINYCFDLWYKNIIAEYKSDEEEQDHTYETNSNITDTNSFVDINKKIINKNIISILNNNSNNKNNKKKLDKSNNKNKSKINKNKINTILKKLILLKENEYKRLYFVKWVEYYPVERAFTTPYSKPKITYLSDIQSPMSTKSDKKMNNYKLNDMKKELISSNFKDNKNIKSENKKDYQNKIKNKEVIIINTDIHEEEKNNVEESFMKSEETSVFNKRGETEVEDEEDEEINSFNPNKKNNNDKNNKIKLLKIKNRLYNILEKINNKKKLYFYFEYWHNLLVLKNEDNNYQTNIMTKIKQQFSSSDKNDENNSINNIGINNRKRKLSDSNIFENFSSFTGNKKRIIVKNDLSDNKIRSRTLLSHQVGNFSINTDNSSSSSDDDDYENISEDIINNPIKNSFTMNIKHHKPKINYAYIKDEEKLDNNIIVNNLKIKNNKDNYILKEKENNINENIYEISKKNINIINKNVDIIKKNSNITLLNNLLEDKYITLLKQNYNMMIGYKMFYLYSLFNGRDDYFKMKYIFNKMRNEKK